MPISSFTYEVMDFKQSISIQKQNLEGQHMNREWHRDKDDFKANLWSLPRMQSIYRSLKEKMVKLLEDKSTEN